MKRFGESRVAGVHGRGQVYKISLTDTFPKRTHILTRYMPTAGERLDNIAYKFYGDTSKWFVIARANGEVDGTICPTPGKLLTIPRID